MKTTIVTISALLLAIFSFAQKVSEKNIPEAVKTAFHTQFPSVINPKWDKEGDHYEASFHLNKNSVSLLFDVKGAIIETETEIDMNQLPAGISDYVKKHYPGKKIRESAKITDAKGVESFEVEIKGIDLLFDNSGKFIKETKD